MTVRHEPPRDEPPVAAALRDWLATVDRDPLGPVYRWALTPPGKLLRPLLLLESTGAVGGRPARSLPAAVGIELAHAASLVHDDIVDGDDLRRGRAATHRRFGTTPALLGADALFFAVFQQLGACRRLGVPDRAVAQAMEVVAAAGRDVVSGAAREIALSGRLAPGAGLPDGADGPVAAYLEMAGLKTAALLGAACEVGAVLGGGSARQTTALTAFGRALGIAFQIRDDLLPYEPGATPGTCAPGAVSGTCAPGALAEAGAPGAAPGARETGPAPGGKPADSDLRNGRPALPLLLAAARAGPRLAALAARPSSPGRTALLTRLLTETGALADARLLAERHRAAALAELAALPPGPHRERLARLARDAAAGARPPAALPGPSGTERDRRPRRRRC